MLGGLLWAPYGVLELIQPWGEDTVYRDELGYEVVIDTLLHRVYSLPGSVALLLTTLGLLAVSGRLGLPAGRSGRARLILTCAALALAILSIVGVVISFDPLFTAPRIFGTLALGVATLLAGIDARRTAATSGGTVLLLTLGLLGLFLLALWPLVNAIAVVTEGVGAAVIALFGLGWALLGFRHSTSGPTVREVAR
jgi:hypothetical protein